jgi:hypothetical protein
MTSDRNEVTAADNPITNDTYEDIARSDGSDMFDRYFILSSVCLSIQCEHSGISKHPEAACVFNVYSSCLNMNYLINFNL